MEKTKEEKKAEKTEKAKEILKKLNNKNPDLKLIWENDICKASDNIFETEINKLKKYFPKLNSDKNSDGRYGGSVFDDLKIDLNKVNEIDIKDSVLAKNKITMDDSTFAKLVYAMVWKMGRIDSIKPIIKGMRNEKIKDDSAQVFFQYGKFLNSITTKNDFAEVEPIMDRFTMKAYLCKENKTVYKQIKNDKNDIFFIQYGEAYRNWYKETVKNCAEKCGGSEQAFWLLNHIMFVLGKAIKN